MILNAMKYLILGCILYGVSQAFVIDTYAMPREFQVHGVISDKMAERFRLFMMKHRGQSVQIHIQSRGGFVSARDKILFYMRRHTGTTTCIVDKLAASAATSIALNCSKRVFAPQATFMFHLPSKCTGGYMKGVCKKPEIVTADNAPIIYKQSVRHLELIVKKYLTEDEWKRLTSGEDVYILGSRFNRLER